MIFSHQLFMTVWQVVLINSAHRARPIAHIAHITLSLILLLLILPYYS